MECTKRCFFETFAYYYPIVFGCQTIMWIISVVIKNPGFVDVAWGLSQFVVGLFIFLFNTLLFKNEIYLPYILGLISIFVWFIRLSGFIFYHRILKRHVDPRYEELAEKNKVNKILFSLFQFEFQGILLMFTSLPLYFVFAIDHKILNEVNITGLVICLIGIIGEAIADVQLQNFKDINLDKTQVLRKGLFKKARHPNLFFELIFWVGMTMQAINYERLCCLISLAGPIILWGLMYFVTIPITTKHMLSSRPNYQEIIDETNVFIPL